MNEQSPGEPDLLLRNARIDSGGPTLDLLITGGRVRPGPESPGRCEVIDLDGRLVLPGLWDAHVHFDQWAAARRR